MAFRWRRSVKIIPGVRLNFSRSGISTSIGGKGMTVNLKRGRATTTVGIPGTGLSYRASSTTRPSGDRSVTSGRPRDSEIVRLVNTVSREPDDDGTTTTYESHPAETTYRVAAILASVSLADADRGQALIRLAGLMPERLPQGVTGAQWARLLMTNTLAFVGTSTTGTPAIRRAIEKSGLLHTSMVPEAVKAVRASLKARAGSEADPTVPVEWYFQGDELRFREYEAPSVRARIPAEVLATFHAKQLEQGQQRLLAPPPERPSFVVSILKSLLDGFLKIALLGGLVYVVGHFLMKWW